MLAFLIELLCDDNIKLGTKEENNTHIKLDDFFDFTWTLS